MRRFTPLLIAICVTLTGAASVLAQTRDTSAAAAAGQARDSAAMPARPAGTASISGVVLSADASAAPVRLARVTLNSVDRGGAAETTTTDASGRFTFRALPAGRYALQASKRAWLDANYGEQRVGRPGTPVAVAAGQQVGDLRIRLTRGAVIAGVVRDSAGEPQPGVTVRVMRYVTKDGMRTLERPVSTNPNDPITDDDGAYRAYGLPPGDYVAVASLRLGDSAGLGGDEIRPLGAADVDRRLASGASPLAPASTGSEPARAETVTYAPVYFPGVADLGDAATIPLAPGEERSGVDIPFRLQTAARVSAVITVPAAIAADLVARQAEGRGECRLTPAGFEDLLTQPLAASVSRPGADQRAVFAGIPPGRYTIACVAGVPGGPGGPLLLGWAEAAVSVSGQDQDVAMTLATASVLPGRIAFVGANPPKDAAPEVQIVARGFGKARLLRSDFQARPTATGAFSFAAIVPGQWLISATVPRNSAWTVKSITYGGRDLDTLIDVTAGAMLAELVVTLTDRPSELAGVLQDVAGRPASDYFVVAFSADRAAWSPASRRVQTTRPASDGEFSIKGLPAGEYYLAALADVEPGEWLSPSFLDEIVTASVRVTIASGETTLQSIRIAR